MNFFIEFITFVFKQFNFTFILLIFSIITIALIYSLLHFYFENGYIRNKKNKKITIIQKIKGRIYGIKPELLK